MAGANLEVGKGTTRILIVDDHPLVRRGLIELITSEPDLEVCGEATGVPDALRLVETTCPDILVVDLSLSVGSGLDLVRQVKAKDSRIKMLVYSMHDDLLYAERALRAGALGYINKQETSESVLEAIRQILRDEVYLHRRVTDRLLRRALGRKQVEYAPIESLTERELAVFELIGKGLTTVQIAEHLHRSVKTIEAHRQNIKAKLTLRNSTELTHSAVQWVLENS